MARFDWWVSHFSWIISLPVNMFPTTLTLWNEKEKHNFSLFSILYNRYICMLSSNDNVRQNEPRRAFWARVLKATGWQIHRREQGREEASSCICATSTPGPSKPRLLQHNLKWMTYSDGRRSQENIVFVQGSNCYFFNTNNTTVTSINQYLNHCCEFRPFKRGEIHNHAPAVWIGFKDYCWPLNGHLGHVAITSAQIQNIWGTQGPTQFLYSKGSLTLSSTYIYNTII